VEAIKQSDGSLFGYPGGKTFARHLLYRAMPSLTREIVSPFFGGGSVEFYAAAQGIKVLGYDTFRQLVMFWRQVLDNPVAVSDCVAELLPVNKMKRTAFINERPELTPMYAAKFLLALKYAFGGTLLSSGYVDRGEIVGIRTVKQVRKFVARNVSVEEADWREALDRHPDSFGFFDPPYQPAGRGCLYGMDGNAHNFFNEDEFFDYIAERDGWIMTNANCDKVRKRFKGFRQEEFALRYTMRSRYFNNKTTEVLVFSKY